jgi:hypothetical protein
MAVVSVIIPTHNMAGFVCQAIDSVLRQTYQQLEIIVVDDASEDATISVVASIQDPRLRLVRHREQRGPSAARNSGIQAAAGDLIAFLDADDLWLPAKLARQLEVFAQDPEAGLVYCGVYEVDSDLRFLRVPPPGDRWPSAGDAAFERVARRKPFILAPLSSMVVRRSCFDEVGLFDEAIVQAEEWDLVLRLSLKWNLHCVPEPLVLYRMHGLFLPEKRRGRGILEAHRTTIERGFSYVDPTPRWRALERELLLQNLWQAALYAYAVRQPEAARWAIEQIVAEDPGWPGLTERAMGDSVAHTALLLYDTVTPLDEALSFVRYVFANLPASVQPSDRRRRKILGLACAICAFDSYPRGEIRRVWQGVLGALWYDPSWLSNWGLLKLLFKVFPRQRPVVSDLLAE